MAELNLTDRVQNLLTDMERPDSLPLFQAGMNFNNGKPSFNASSPLMDMMPRRETMGSGVMSDREMERLMNAMPRRETMGSGVMSDREADMVMNAMPSNPMQPLVEMGFGEQVDIILGNPADSDISRQAQQQIINEMGTGMDIDSFLMEVNNLAPKGAMTNIDAEGINELMRFAVKQKVDQSGNPLLKLGVETGRMNDTTLGHLSEGEAVIPAEVLEANPQAAQSLDQTMTEMGINPDSRIVDTTGQINGIASINPETGLQEFGIGSSFQKFRRKVLKPVAKIAAVVPGPWQAPAIIYNKLESGYNIASGKGGIGDLMTVMAGGTQKVGGEGGAWDRIKSGDFAKEGGGTGFFDSAGKAFKGIGSVDGKFNPLQYGKNIASTYRDDQLGGYFGLLGGGEQPLPEEIQYDPVNQGYINTKTGMPVSDEEIKALQGGSFIGGTKTPSFIKGIEDTLKGQTDPSSSSLFANNDQGGMGMMGKLGIAGLAGLIGKLAYEEAKDQKGVPLTPLTQMDQLGRYNIEAEIARRTGAEAPSRVEFGLNPEGMPALSGGSPRMAAFGGIMNLNGGGSTGFAERMEVADKLIDSLIPTRKETGAAINEDERNLLNRYSIDRAVEAVPFVPNFIENLVQSDKYKDFESATMDFITPALRHESGAAITYDEINAMKKSLIPMPGDREEVIEAKSMARKNIINKMRSMNSDTQEPNKTKVFAPQRRYDGGILNLSMGGMPRYNFGGGVQYFNQGGTVAMAEGGDMDATINIENFPAKDGQIDGPGTEVSDDIPAMLSDGEFVMTAKAVKGAGAFNINDNNGILTLTPNGDPSRDSGTRVMYKLMEHFGKVA
jgi:hypothetical protein